jgi:predicted GH43/DUF377 family glycosyl hydrolase
MDVWIAWQWSMCAARAKCREVEWKDKGSEMLVGWATVVVKTESRWMAMLLNPRG